MSKYTKSFNTGVRATKNKVKVTSQMEKTPGLNEVVNNAGGYVFKVSDLEYLKRFLILGSEGGSFYVGEKKLTKENAVNVINVIKTAGVEAVKTIVEYSTGGRAPKNDPAIFALALAVTFGDDKTRQAAYAAIPRVCRIGTHLFQFTEAIQELRGWSRGLRNGVGKFYTGKTDQQLALQLIKYRQRNGWTHRDVLRLAHIKPTTDSQAQLLRWAVGKEAKVTNETVLAFEAVQKLRIGDEKLATSLITDNDLPWEALPTELLNSKLIWQTLVQNGMPMTALLRNLGKLTSIGVLDSNLSDYTKKVVSQFADVEAIKKARLHPLNILVALKYYSQGHGLKGNLSWAPIKSVVDALDDAFYLAFTAAPVTNKNYMLAVDCSGSIGSAIAGMPISSVEAAGALAMVTAKNEPFCEAVYFSSASGYGGRGSSGIGKLNISPKLGLDEVVKLMLSMRWGGTDCALPMIYATQNKIPVDVFQVITDNETWAGTIKPFQALREYRQKMGRDAKLIVIGTEATPFTIADPSDKGMLDVVGFDTSVPEIMASFVRGDI